MSKHMPNAAWCGMLCGEPLFRAFLKWKLGEHDHAFSLKGDETWLAVRDKDHAALAAQGSRFRARYHSTARSVRTGVSRSYEIGAQIMTDPKHISQLGKMQQARANQDMQDALLSIVAQQGKTVRIPLAIAQGVASTHRMVLVRDTDPETGEEFIELSVEKADVVITDQKTKLIQ